MSWLSGGWLLLQLIVIFIGIWFFYFYYKDKDKRKLMFALAFLSSSISYLCLAMGYHTESNLFLQNLYQWTSMPLMVAIFIAVSENVYRVKDFDRLLKIFLIFYIFSFVMVIIPLSIEIILAIVRQVMAGTVIIVSSYAFLKRRDLPILMFLLALVCFTVAGVTLARNVEEMSIFSYLVAYVFLTLVFVVSSSSIKKDKHGVGSYFSLKKKLETAETALRESEERYRKIVENTRDAVMLTRPDGIISYMSPACDKVLGHKPEELMGKQPWIIHPDDLEKVKEIHYQALKGKGGTNFKYRIITKTGETKWVSHSWSPILADGKLQMIVSTMQDITEQKITEEEIRKKIETLKRNERATFNIMDDLQETQENLRVLNENLEQRVQKRTAEVENLLRQKDEFINQLGHDLKNPLNPLLNLLPLVNEREQNPQSKEMLEVIIRNVEYMKNLVIKTIELARLTSHSTKFSFEVTNLLNEVNNIIKKNQLLFNQNNLEVNNRVERNIYVKADKLRLEELFNNLISNAVKYSKDPGTITIDAKKDKGFVTVSVEDTGIGMNKEQLTHVFDEFYKADPSRHDFESSGLGMSICKRIVEKQGGNIWAESLGLEKGTTIFFTLPSAAKSKKISIQVRVGNPYPP